MFDKLNSTYYCYSRTRSISCSPTGRAWAAASTGTVAFSFSLNSENFYTITLEGVLIYSIDHMLLFDPLDLDTECNPETIMKALDDKEYLKSVVVCAYCCAPTYINDRTDEL